MPQCDICNRPITDAEMFVLPAGPIVSATMTGYFPRRTPDHYRALDPATQRATWSSVVEANSVSDWGLCAECHRDVLAASEQPDARTVQSDMEDMAAQIRSQIAANPKLQQWVNERLGKPAPPRTPPDA